MVITCPYSSLIMHYNHAYTNPKGDFLKAWHPSNTALVRGSVLHHTCSTGAAHSTWDPKRTTSGGPARVYGI